MAARKARKPKHQKSEYPTLPGQLGYLNSYYCPVCGKHLFSAYDKDMKKDREDGYYFHVSNDFNYCSKCGQLLDLDEWKRKEEPPEAAEEKYGIVKEKCENVKFYFEEVKNGGDGG